MNIITSSNMERMERILAEGPRFHRADTEVEDQTFGRSMLPKTRKMRMQNLKGRQNWGITPPLARYIVATIKPGMRTLEIGSGISTLAFAIGGAVHTAVAPDPGETAEIMSLCA